MESSDKDNTHVLRVADLAASKVVNVDITPSSNQSEQIRLDLELVGIRKIRMTGRFAPQGKRDWELTASVGATVTQTCVVTLAPVITRIEEKITRLYLATLPEHAADEDEAEMPQDDHIEALPSEIDFLAVLQETIALALPLYPRAPEAALEQATFTEPGKVPMQDQDARPFAALAGLRDKLGDTSKE